MTPKPFNLNRPAHHIANDVMRQLEQIAHDSGVEIAFGVKSHNVVARLVQQYQDKLMDAHNRVEFDYDICVECGGSDLTTDAATGMRVCGQCGNAQ